MDYSCERRLKEIHDFIKKDSIYYAKKVVNEIFLKSKTLNEFPKIGRIVPEIYDENIREIIIYSYRIIYRICESKIEVLAVMHGKMNFNKDILERE